jgi:hypothetical protein
LAEIKGHLQIDIAVQTRLANTEADISGVRREMKVRDTEIYITSILHYINFLFFLYQDLRNLLQNNATPTSQAACVQAQKISQHIGELNHLYIWCDIILLQEPFTLGEQMSMPKNPIGTPNTVHDLQNKTPPQPPNKHYPMPTIPISTTASDYALTQQDIEVAYFLRNSYAQAEVVLVGDNVAVNVHMLLPNITKIDDIRPSKTISFPFPFPSTLTSKTDAQSYWTAGY